MAAAERFVPNLEQHIVAHDTFTPTTIVHFTGHETGRCTARRKNGTMQKPTWRTC